MWIFTRFSEEMLVFDYRVLPQNHLVMLQNIWHIHYMSLKLKNLTTRVSDQGMISILVQSDSSDKLNTKPLMPRLRPKDSDKIISSRFLKHILFILNNYRFIENCNNGSVRACVPLVFFTINILTKTRTLTLGTIHRFQL